MQSWLESLESKGYNPIRGKICPGVRKDKGSQVQGAADCPERGVLERYKRGQEDYNDDESKIPGRK
jgi:hypothetical protein